MSAFLALQESLRKEPRTWLVTGVAGFIGSHLLERLLSLRQRVTGLDNFASGSEANLREVRARVGEENWSRFSFHRGSVTDLETCQTVAVGADYILHHAGFVSVPLSIENPLACHDTNVTGNLHILLAARDHRVRCVVYASSSAVYGDSPELPNTEERIGRPLSPYGASKLMGEIQAGLFHRHFAIASVGLRYFNIFGPRQSLTGGYAAVIPQWISALLTGSPCIINGDGHTTRDFCPVSKVIQANLLAAAAPRTFSAPAVFNVALGARTTLQTLHALLADAVCAHTGGATAGPLYRPARPGDIPHSGADISRIVRELGYSEETDLALDLAETVHWYATNTEALKIEN